MSRIPRPTNPSRHYPGDSSVTIDVHELMAQLEIARAEQEPLALTIGVEIEFLLAHCRYPDNGAGTILGGPQAELLVKRVLAEPMTAKCSDCGKMHRFSLLLSASIARSGEYSQWQVARDESVEPFIEELQQLGKNARFYDFYSCEVKSRILRAGEPLLTTRNSDGSHMHRISAIEEITAVLRHLSRSFGPSAEVDERRSWRLFTNATCGLHVHIGNESRGIPLQTVKNALGIYIAFERELDTLHAIYRVGGATPTPPGYPFEPKAEENNCINGMPPPYNHPLSAQHARMVHDTPTGLRTNYYPFNSHEVNVVEALRQYSPAAHITLLQRASDLQALHTLQWTDGHSCTVNLDNLKPFLSDEEQKTGTIEFRQAAGTLEPEVAVAWVDVLCKLVTYSHHVKPQAHASSINKRLASGRWDPVKLLQDLGCSSKTIDLYEYQMSGGYAEALEEEAAAFASVATSKDMFAPFMAFNMECKAAAYNPVEVENLVDCKMKTMGYGQFPDSVVDDLQLDFNDDHPRDRLRAGWTYPFDWKVTLINTRPRPIFPHMTPSYRFHAGKTRSGFTPVLFGSPASGQHPFTASETMSIPEGSDTGSTLDRQDSSRRK